MYNLRAIAATLVEMPSGGAGGRARAGPPFQMPYTLALPRREHDRWVLHRDLLDASQLLTLAQLASARATWSRSPSPTGWRWRRSSAMLGAVPARRSASCASFRRWRSGGFGAAPTPMDNYDAVVDPERPLASRTLVPAETLRGRPGNRRVASTFVPDALALHGGRQGRPVAPFLDVGARRRQALTDGGQLEPLTIDAAGRQRARRRRT